MSERSNKPVQVSSSPGSARGATEVSERRQRVRYPFTATAEVTDLSSQLRVTGRSSDLGLGGCYVDTISPLPGGTKVRVRLEQSSRRFEAIATVAYQHPSLGMGLVFATIEPEPARVLHKWVAELSGERLPEPEPKPQMDARIEGGKPTDTSDVGESVSELIKLLVRKKLIHDYEGAALLNKISR